MQKQCVAPSGLPTCMHDQQASSISWKIVVYFSLSPPMLKAIRQRTVGTEGLFTCCSSLQVTSPGLVLGLGLSVSQA